jgi:hypothetical protein
VSEVLAIETGHLEHIRSRVADGEPGGKIFCRETGDFLGWYSSTYPDWFRNKGLRRKEVLEIIDKRLRDETLTDRQSEMLADLVWSSADEYHIVRGWDGESAVVDLPWDGFLESAGDFLDDAGAPGGPGGMTMTPLAFAGGKGWRREPSILRRLLGIGGMSAMAGMLGGDASMTDRRGPPRRDDIMRRKLKKHPALGRAKSEKQQGCIKLCGVLIAVK